MNIKKNIPNTITLLNGASGIISILFSIKQQYTLAISFIILSIILDFLDGTIAQLLKVKSNLGAELDSLSDIISFGVAPTILFIMKFNFNLSIIIVSILYTLAGIYRLGEYNIGTRKTKHGFIGIPITFGALILILISLIQIKLLTIILILITTYLLISKHKIQRLKI